MSDNEKYDMEELSKSLTGFDEIAIQQRFRSDFTELPGTIAARALLFVQRRREGLKDVEAYNEAMGMRIDDVEKCFEIPEAMREAAEGKLRSQREGTQLMPTS